MIQKIDLDFAILAYYSDFNTVCQKQFFAGHSKAVVVKEFII